MEHNVNKFVHLLSKVLTVNTERLFWCKGCVAILLGNHKTNSALLFKLYTQTILEKKRIVKSDKHIKRDNTGQ